MLLAFLGLSHDTWQSVGVIVAIITAVAAALVFIIRQFFKLGIISQRIKNVEATSETLEAEIKGVSSKLDQLIGKVAIIAKDAITDSLSVSNSPRQLSELGKKVLVDSSIEQTLDPLFDQILEQVKSLNPENPYQAQESLFDVVQSLKSDEGLRSAIENGAFLSGHSPEEVLFVGALNIRDKVIESLGLQVGDIDKHDPAKQ